MKAAPDSFSFRDRVRDRISASVVPALLLMLVAALVTASGCATRLSRQELDPARFLHDEAFPRHAEYAVETRRDVFGLDQAAKNHIDRKINSIRDFHKRGRALIDEIFHQAALNLSYESNANTTATETFHNRSGNCLSMSILAYAMAEYAGFDATFQEVDIPEYWERRENFSLMSRHVNLRITPALNRGTVLLRKIELEIDFQPLAGIHRPPTRSISQDRTLAMFHNNKAVDALLANNRDQAYAYLKAALLHDPSLDMALTNLGLLYAVNGERQWAEETFRQATRINRDNPVAARHLATLLRKTNREHEADAILAKLERRRQDNPYYLYIQGEEAYDDGNWSEAIRHYRKAISIKPNSDEFHFGLARTYTQLGEHDMARASLRRAERYANYADLKQKYRNKLTVLSEIQSVGHD